MPNDTTGKKRGRPRTVESFSEWMARIDIEVTKAAEKFSRKVPAKRALTGPQTRILEMLADHMRSLPAPLANESHFSKPAFSTMNEILTTLFKAKYPAWVGTKRAKNGSMDVEALPHEAAK